MLNIAAINEAKQAAQNVDREIEEIMRGMGAAKLDSHPARFIALKLQLEKAQERKTFYLLTIANLLLDNHLAQVS